ncbi:unnamed protein product, partial [Larinioides sclopetarius]
MDLDLMIDILNDYYPGSTKILSILEQVCEDFEKGKEAATYWYEEREKKKLIQTAEQSQALMNARACFFLMV